MFIISFSLNSAVLITVIMNNGLGMKRPWPIEVTILALYRGG
jgi:hypothetical protein